MAITSADYDVYYGTTVTDGKLVPDPADWGYASPKNFLMMPGFSLDVEVDFVLTGANGHFECYSLLENGDHLASNWYYIYLPKANFGASGTWKFTLSPEVDEGQVALNAGENRMMLSWDGANITDIRATLVALPVTSNEDGVILDHYTSYNDGSQATYAGNYPEICKVWDDVVLTAYNVSGLAEWDYISACAARWVPPATEGVAPSLEVGPQDPPPVLAPFPTYPPSDVFSGTISWLEQLAPGVAVAVVSEVYDVSTTLAIVYDVDPDTLVVTQRELIHVPAPEYHNSDMALVAQGDGRLLLMGLQTDGSTVFCSLTYAAGAVVAAFSRPVMAYPRTMCWVDFGSMFVEMRLSADGTQVEVYSHDVVDGMPTEAAVLRFSFPRVNGWDYDAVYATKVSDTTFYVAYSNYYSTPFAYVRVVDVASWTIGPEVELGQTSAYNSMHQNDWISIEAMPDRPGSALIHLFRGNMGRDVKLGGTVARFDGESIKDQKVFYPYNVTTDNSTRANVNDLVGAYLGAGRFVALAYADYASYRVEAPNVIYNAPIAFAGQLPVEAPPPPVSDYLGARRRFW